MILTVNEIIRRFRTEGSCYKFKPKTITYMASRLGYSIRRIGGKVGYDQSLITAISRHFKEAVDYDKGIGVKHSQKSQKRPNLGDYYTYNGERDNDDYEWEKNEDREINENMDKQVLTGLWLDDSRRDPNKFLNKKNDSSESGAVVRNWYKRNMSNNDIQWTAVSNFWEFKEYIEKNGVPDFVSLDHDLGKDARTKALKNNGQYAPSGADCALFLVSYCLRSGIPIPKNYIHSANDNQRVYISKAFRLGRMGKDPMDGIDLDNDQEFAEAADNFRHGIIATKDMIKKGQLGTADRLARMKGIKNPNDLFGVTSFRENRSVQCNNTKRIIRLTESDLHRIVKESVNGILKKYNYDTIY